jgi:hypothetical protein
MKPSVIIVFALILAVAAIGCASMTSGASDNSSSAPTISVLDTIPADGASSVPLSGCVPVSPVCGAIFVVKFNEQLPVNDLAFVFDPPLNGRIACPNGSILPGCPTGILGPSGNPIPPQSSEIVFVGASPYQADTQYKVTLENPGYQIIPGFPKNLTWTFSTSPN